mgnify:CR=1 FL=1
MNKSQEELERTCEITFAKYGLRWTSDNKEMRGVSLSSQLAQSILSAGYVKLSDIELDEKKIENKIESAICKFETIKQVAHAIAQAKPIRVKENV